MTRVEGEERGANQEPQTTLVLQGWEVYGSLFFHFVLFWVTVLLCRWAFVRLFREPLDLVSLGVQELVGLIFVFWAFGVIMYEYAKAVFILVHSAKRIVKEGDTIAVERVLGRWCGSVQDLRLRKGSFGWLVTLGRARHQLVLANGRLVAEIIWLRNVLEERVSQRRSLEENLALLRQWFQDADEGQAQRLRPFFTGATNLLRHRLSSFSLCWPWVGKLLWWAQVIGAYLALVVALLIFSKLSWLSLFAMVFLIGEAFAVLCLLGAVRAGEAVHRGIESAFKALQVAVGVFVVTVTWDWLGAMHGHAWLVVIMGMLQAMAIALEWAAPGAVFLAFARGGEARIDEQANASNV